MMPKRPVPLALALMLSATLALPAAADPVEDFYKGKTITLANGFSPGGDYDLRMRLVGRHISKHIPGNPNVIYSNMPGAGGIVVNNWLANIAPKDGTTIVAIAQNSAVHQSTGAPNVKFDVRKLGWIGNTTDTPNVVNAWHTTGIQSIQDVMQRELVVGATGIGSSSYLYPYALSQLVGAKFKIVTGYPGGNDVNIAMERGEVGGRGSNSWASWKSTRPQWLADKKIIILVQVALKRAADLPDVPTMVELAKNETDKQIMSFISADTAISRAFVTTPDVPPERLAALRRAFDATMKDPEFLADAAKVQMDISPMTGEEAQKVATATVESSQEVRDRANALMQGK
jgi:tripartite-type tricarboxylate transporter receptor subunit TctC